MSTVSELIEEQILQDRALFAPLYGECYWCRDIIYLSDPRTRKNRDKMVFCSDYCRRLWHKAAR